ncbi:MAG TPA: energy transducer TonB [Terriglobales bacterium]|nr:energy transducer TonB [Terriglobales bacterium]
MPSYIDHHSDLVQSIPYPVYQGPGFRIDAWGAAVPREKKEKRAVSSKPQITNTEGLLFEDTLIVSGQKSRPRNTWAAVGSLTLQSLLLAAVVIIPLYHTEMLPKLGAVTMLYAPPPPPPPPAASTATRFSRPVPVSTYKPTSISLPSPVQKTQEVPPTSDGIVGGVVGGVPGGVIGGMPGGVLGGVLATAGTAAPVLAKAPGALPVKRVRLAQRVVEANLIHDVAPTYPPEAGRARIQGSVVLMAVIGKDGSIEDVRVESGLPILAQAAIDAVKQWRYKPYLLNGEPVEVDSRITINFTLSS